MKKLIAFMLVSVLCLVCLSACVNSGADGTDDGSVSIEDVEDVEIGKGRVTLINDMGKDAVELLARPSGTSDWSKTILSDDSLRAGVAVEFTYTQSGNNVFDVRLVFDDGTYQDFSKVDFKSDNAIKYLGLNQ